MEAQSPIDLGRVAQDLQLRKLQVAAVVDLLDSGNTVPFITRYRKEQTGGLDEEQIRAIQHRVGYLRQMADRRQTILRTIESQGKLTEELKAAIERAETAKRLEDLYLPYKPKKQTLATIAREKGLGPLADAIWSADEAARELGQVLPGMLNPDKQLTTIEEVLAGVQHILAERIAEDAEIRDAAREVLWSGRLLTSRATTAESPPPASTGEPMAPLGLDEFRNYFRYEEPIRHVPPHRLLAINRGERRGILRVRLDFDREALLAEAKNRLPLSEHPHREFLEKCVVDAVDRLLVRSLEREVRNEVTEFAEFHAVDVFARNLRNLLLQPPVHNRRVMAIDPGYRTGCKWAVLDEIGNLLEHGTVFPHLKRKKKKKKEGTESHRPTPVADVAVIDAATVSVSNPVAADPTLPPPIEADSVSRNIEPEASEDHALTAEIDKDWQEIQSRMPDRKPKDRKHRRPPPREESRPTEPTTPRLLHPAWFGIVIPPPGLFLEVQDDPWSYARADSRVDNISRRDRAKQLFVELCRRHNVEVLAIGNGTACRETEELVAEVIAEDLSNVAYVIVNEAGASVYSTSPIGREEFPDFDATLRSTISIGRRLQDPLSELVKIDPQNIGVGLYQHDINPKILKESLSEVVESCVNYVGVDLNTASVPLLRYVSGLNHHRARNLAEYRKEHGPFQNRAQLQDVPGIGPETFTQAAGFLKISQGQEALDCTWIHPESYPIAERLLESMGYDRQALLSREASEKLRAAVAQTRPEKLAEGLEAGEPTIRDILDNLIRPGRDPREDLPKPIFRTGILRIEDLTPGLLLRGTVLNVVDFGVFVDIGLKDSGLVHISELADRFIRSPHDVVAVGDVVTTWVLKVDMERRRVSLTMIDPSRLRERGHRGERRQDDRRGERPQRPQGTASMDGGQDRRAPRGAPDQGQQSRQVAASQGQGARQGDGQGQRERPSQDRHQRGRRHSGRRQDQHRQDAAPAQHQTKRRERPPVKLSDEKLAGKEVLNTFGELKALFEHKKKATEPKKSPPDPTPPPEPTTE